MKLVTLFIWISTLAIYKVIYLKNVEQWFHLLQALVVTLNSPFIRKRSKSMIILGTVSQFLFTFSLTGLTECSILIIALADFAELMMFTVIQIRSKPSSFLTALILVIVLGIGCGNLLKISSNWWNWRIGVLILASSFRTFALSDMEPCGTLAQDLWSCLVLVPLIVLFYVDVWNSLLGFVTASLVLSLESNLALRVFSEVQTHWQTAFNFSLVKVMRSQILLWILSDIQYLVPILGSLGSSIYFGLMSFFLLVIFIPFEGSGDGSYLNYLQLPLLLMRSFIIKGHTGGSREISMFHFKCTSKFRKSLVKIPDPKLLLHKPQAMPQCEFLTLNLTHYPKIADLRSGYLSKNQDVIDEAQRVHANVLGDLLERFSYAILFDLADYENKGDPAIAMGELQFLKRLGIQLLYYCKTSACSDKNVENAFLKFKDVSSAEMVVLLQGGGNMFSYESLDKIRESVITRFQDHTIVIFPQSIWLRYADYKLDYYRQMYNSHPDLTLLVRDQESYAIGEQMLPSAKVILCPDMAFQIGLVAFFAPASFDILWLKREDSETTGYVIPRPPPYLSLHVEDWTNWITPKTDTMEHIFHLTLNGLLFLQRGKVVITDRLHGHILSTLLGIPHVILDNNYGKVFNYHNSWTKGLETVRTARTAEQALAKAEELLSSYGGACQKNSMTFCDYNENLSQICK
ncbi:uncharacterized protein LOC131878636 isoform X2 [Tigriopus californicus]|uniref:uncharacterized protein LOC131878636 isoform X2 n=1 Tax=Tigriopus californicus TaxID=6832 RepID=UPI0027DA64CC|nr:uncharacterized protein LOC131878636 isoform X2 [Tigriopus californicus]